MSRTPLGRSQIAVATRAAAVAVLVVAAAAAVQATPSARTPRPVRPATAEVARIVKAAAFVREAVDLAHAAPTPIVGPPCRADRPLPCIEAHAERTLDSIAAWLDFIARFRAFLGGDSA